VPWVVLPRVEEDSLVTLDERLEASQITCPASVDECEVICILIDIHAGCGKVGGVPLCRFRTRVMQFPARNLYVL